MTGRSAEDVVKGTSVEVAKLVVAYVGQDCVVGELDALHRSSDSGTDPPLPRGCEIVDRVITLRNPKRLLTLRMHGPQGVVFNSFIAPLEVVEGGSISLKPTMAYTLNEASELTRQSVLGLYADHLAEMKNQRASRAGPPSRQRPRPFQRSRC